MICQKTNKVCNVCGYKNCQHVEGAEYPIESGASRPSGDCNTCGLGPCTCKNKD